jgi:DNA-binding transcriptional MerR regulator
MAIPSPRQRRDTPSEIPDKLYFRIGDVAKICQVPPYVLRFWESEFHQLKPNKSGTGQRLYRKRDVEMSLRIKRLLYDEGYTIPGARQLLQAEAREQRKRNLGPELPLPPSSGSAAFAGLEKVRKELRELAAMLSGAPSPARPGRLMRSGKAPTGQKPVNLFEM